MKQLLNWFRLRNLESGLDRELKYHIDRRVADLMHSTAIYSLVDQVVLHALPVHEPERLVLIDWQGDPLCCGMGTYNLMSYPICRDLQQQNRFFEGVLCRAATTVNLSTGGDNRPAAAEIVSGSYFPVLGVSAALGRVLGSDDDGTPGTNPVVVLSYDFWKTQLASAPDVIGRKVLIRVQFFCT